MPEHWTELLTEEERAEVERGWPMRNIARSVAASRALVAELKKKGRAVIVLDDLPPPYECDGPCPQHEFLDTLVLTEADMLKEVK